MATVRARQLEAASGGQSDSAQGTAYAQKCVDDIIAGARNFDNEAPQVQALIQYLATALDQLRALPKSGRPQSTVAQACDISTAPPTPTQAAADIPYSQPAATSSFAGPRPCKWWENV